MLPISYNNVRDILYNTDVINSIFKLIVHSPVGKLVQMYVVVVVVVLLFFVLFGFCLFFYSLFVCLSNITSM